MFRDVMYILFMLLVVVGIYLGYMGIQRQAYLYYSPLFVSYYTRANKEAKDLESYATVKRIHDEIFHANQMKLQKKVVESLIQINQKFSMKGEFRKSLDKFNANAMQSPESDFLLMREFQENSKLLPPESFRVPKSLFYLTLPDLSISFTELLQLESTEILFFQKMALYENILKGH